MLRLADLTTLRLGGPPHHVVDALDQDTLVQAVRQCDHRSEPVLIVGGGSNLVVADQGFEGTVIRVLSVGTEEHARGDRVLLTAQAGESWDRLVERCVSADLTGIECLAGIPGTTGATPIQNVGAYGQEIAESVVEVTVYDRLARKVRSLSQSECQFSYRSSALKQHMGRWVVLQVSFALTRRAIASPIRYAELARRLGISCGESATPARVRAAVLDLRRSKGMVLAADDVDTVSAGSFFLNPMLSASQVDLLRARVHARFGAEVEPPLFNAGNGNTKTSAAWLIEHAGFHKGYGASHGIAISTKHTLALTNRGQGTTAELLLLARQIADAVGAAFGVELMPEPVFVGCSW